MNEYLNAMRRIMAEGEDRPGRNGMTRSLLALQLRFDLANGFPAVTTKRLAWRAVVGELVWFLSGSGDDNDLRRIMGTDRTIWTDNAEDPKWRSGGGADLPPGDLGRVYGVQWRQHRTPVRSCDDSRWLVRDVDQIAKAVETLRTDPQSRRNLVFAWNPGELDQMALPPCHLGFQLLVMRGRLNLVMTQRSGDMFLGVPFNIASYALLLSMFAQCAGIAPGEVVLNIADAHVYHAHFDAVHEQLAREPNRLPVLWLNPDRKSVTEFTIDDAKLLDYEYHPPIKAPMIV